jgi:hypothetical protein
MGTCRYFGTDSSIMNVAEATNNDVFPPDSAGSTVGAKLASVPSEGWSEGDMQHA